MINVFCGFGALVVGAVIYWIVCCIRSIKDPNVQNAAKLKMPINRYLLYKKLYDEYYDFMMEHGANSIASERKFIEIFKQKNILMSGDATRNTAQAIILFRR